MRFFFLVRIIQVNDFNIVWYFHSNLVMLALEPSQYSASLCINLSMRVENMFCVIHSFINRVKCSNNMLLFRNATTAECSLHQNLWADDFDEALTGADSKSFIQWDTSILTGYWTNEQKAIQSHAISTCLGNILNSIWLYARTRIFISLRSFWVILRVADYTFISLTCELRKKLF